MVFVFLVVVPILLSEFIVSSTGTVTVTFGTEIKNLLINLFFTHEMSANQLFKSQLQ